VPATFGAVLDWPWWVTYALIVPGVAWYLRTEARRYYLNAQASSVDTTLADRLPIIGAICWFATLALIGQDLFGTQRFSGLLGAVGLVLQDLWFLRDQTGGSRAATEGA
jgi:hypothetical protein